MKPLLNMMTVADFAWLEVFYWGAGIVVAIAIIYGVKQVRAALSQAQCALEQNRLSLEQLELSRKDIVLRSKREALTLAIKECEYWANEILPALAIVTTKLEHAKFIPSKTTDPAFPFIENPSQPAIQVWNDIPLRNDVIRLLNKMEAFAMYFATDLAAEDAAFFPTGGPFCEACERFAVFIGFFRQDNGVKLYNNVVKLYGIWKPRAQMTVLENQEQALQTQKSKLTQPKFRPSLGTQPL